MENNHHVEGLLGNTIETLKGLLGQGTIVGDPIQAQGVTLIPVSRLSIGVGGGGSDYISKNQKPEQNNTFGGGAAASAKVEPVAFLAVHKDTVKVIHMTPPPATVADRIIDAAPDLMDRLAEFLENQKEKKDFEKEDKNTIPQF